MFLQICVNIIFTSSIYALMAYSFGIIYQTSKFFHFAHAIIFTFGAYFAYSFYMVIGIPLILAIILSMILSGILGGSMDLIIYRPLRRKGSTNIGLLLSSLGIYILMQNTISLIWGDATKIMKVWEVTEGLEFFGARITIIQIVIIISSTLMILLISTFLFRSKFGKKNRAVSNDIELAKISGLNSNLVISQSFIVASSLGGFAGILLALDVGLVPTMGMNTFMMGVIVMIIGGVGSTKGTVFASLLLSTIQNLGILFIGTKWQDLLAFILLVLFLIYRPKGFFGKKINKVEI